MSGFWSSSSSNMEKVLFNLKVGRQVGRQVGGQVGGLWVVVIPVFSNHPTATLSSSQQNSYKTNRKKQARTRRLSRTSVKRFGVFEPLIEPCIFNIFIAHTHSPNRLCKKATRKPRVSTQHRVFAKSLNLSTFCDFHQEQTRQRREQRQQLRWGS